jgi:hypothetical protein
MDEEKKYQKNENVLYETVEGDYCEALQVWCNFYKKIEDEMTKNDPNSKNG